jgi:hypothetical protein
VDAAASGEAGLRITLVSQQQFAQLSPDGLDAGLAEQHHRRGIPGQNDSLQVQVPVTNRRLDGDFL